MKQKYLLRGLMACLMLALANISVCADENEIFVSYVTMTNDDGTTEQIPMRFKVLNDKTSCAVYAQKDEVSGTWNAAVNKNKTGRLTIPSEANGYKVTGIDSYAFQECNFSSVDIPNTIITIGMYAFYKCNNLSSVEIPYVEGSSTMIFQGAFSHCEKLKSVHLPRSISCSDDYEHYFFNDWFAECDALTDVQLDWGIRFIPAYCFWGCKSLKTITIPSSVEAIGSKAFQNSTSLENIVFDEGSLKKIGQKAFNKTAIKNLLLPEGLEEIEEGAFDNISSMESAIIPNSVTKIGNNAFKGCQNLKNVYLCAQTQPMVSSTGGAFSSINTNATLHVPNKNNYSSYWNDWFRYVISIEPIEQSEVHFYDYTYPMGGEYCDADVTTNVVGSKPAYVSYRDRYDEYGYYVNPVMFGPNENLNVTMTFTLYDGFTFATNPSKAILHTTDGRSIDCDVVSIGNNYYYSFSWYVKTEVPPGGIDITSINLSILEPVSGNTIQNIAFRGMPFKGAMYGYTIASARWFVFKDGVWRVPEQDVFETGDYMMAINLNRMDGYNFIPDIPVIVNGKEADAFYILTNGNEANVYKLYKIEDLVATDIGDAPLLNVHEEMTDVEGQWYSLDGRRLSCKPTQPGIYVHGRKKVVIR